ncbi:MAG: dockerin type I repeat-containing protein, partial [Clostridia bacterium]|nr:dockerin type I repeat-containing protein [Clostridia bacterium]
YSDGSKFDLIDSDYTISAFDSSTVGSKTVTVSYGSKTCALQLSVIDYGDIDMDYSWTSADMLKLQQHFFGITSLSDMGFTLADIDKNGVLDSTDILTLQTKILGIF